MSRYSIGFDYGTNSVRALLVDVADGSEIATAVFNYPSGEAGVLYDEKDTNLARQNPADYVEGFFATAKEVLATIAMRHVDIWPFPMGVPTCAARPPGANGPETEVQACF